jgi:DNA-binding transcriptional MerR regulator
MSERVPLPDKLYFKIGEVAKLVGVKPYVLRYWETEFSVLRPGKTRSKHRLYRRKDVETLLDIRRLLHQERYTIEGAKRKLRDAGRLAAGRPSGPRRHLCARARAARAHRMLSGVTPAPRRPSRAAAK